MQHYEAPIRVWASERDDIRVVLIVGSYGRQTADAHSDFDLMIYSSDWREYLADTGWLAQFGTVLVMLREDIGEGRPEFLAVYDNGDKLDFAFDRVEKLRHIASLDALPEVLDRGYRVLVDKDGITAQFPPAPESQPAHLPTPAEFAATLDAFWYGALYVARQIKRGNLWTVKYRDWTMKQQLLTMIEWHTRAVHGWHTDTWYEGKLITCWADPDTLDALNGCFGHFDAADSWRALLATMALFRRLATDTARHLGYAYPAALDDGITRCIHAL